ncbi:hypothetical protein Tco_0628581 [Tanacetum coccineum]|uniref:Uncharacterized protein n=1 Tax=Tanacetum coccineum TaxID=301880 RepID=A0ABQ4WQR0_9ASTR
MISINRGLIQAIPTSLPPQPIGEVTKASNLQRILLGVQGRSHFTYFLYLIVQVTNPIRIMRNIMDEVDIEDLTIEQYFSLTQENQTTKKIKDMTIAEYVEYKKKMNKNHISNTKTYLPTYFSKSAPTHDPIREFSHYFVPNQPGAESNYDSEDIDEEVEYMTDDKVVMSEQEESNHGNTQNIQHFEEKDDVDKWLNAELTKHMSMQGVENTEDALISIINNEVDTDDDNTSPTTSCLLPNELSPGNNQIPIPQEHQEQEENEQLPIRPRPCNYSFEEWLKIRIGHNNLHESDREFIFNEWILDSYDVEEEYAREIGYPYSKRFDEYNRVFKNEIEQLSNEYILRI